MVIFKKLCSEIRLGLNTNSTYVLVAQPGTGYSRIIVSLPHMFVGRIK